MDRRDFCKASGMGGVALATAPWSTLGPDFWEIPFGIADASYMMRRYRKMPSDRYPPFADALDMIDNCSTLGFRGMQVGVGGWDKSFAKKVRRRKEELDVFLEAQIRLPEDSSDVARFEAEVANAKETGISVFRTVCLSGRRYENFESLDDFERFKSKSRNSIALAEPVVRRHQVALAIENHKDWRVSEMLGMLREWDSEWIGVTLDTGNNIALLDDPMEVVESLAPYAFSVHLKDMAVAEYEDGFLLSEVNLGTGFLDIEGMIGVIRKHRPDVRFNLEMITRDPLEVPCLTEKYWATFGEVSASELATYLHGIRAKASEDPLPHISDKPTDSQLALEVANNLECLKYAKNELGFS